LLLDWLRRPEITSYAAGLLASGGFMSLFSPIILLLATPLGAVNVMSTWSWTYSEGAHYSITLIPFVIVSAIYGLGNLRELLRRWLPIPLSYLTGALSLLVLVSSTWHHHEVGVSPLGKAFQPPQITAHHRLGHALIRLIPAKASLAADGPAALPDAFYTFTQVEDRGVPQPTTTTVGG
jgi:hypothetical protein